MKITSFLMMFVLCANVSAQKKSTAAVLSFVNSGGVDKNEISILTDRFSNYLVNTDVYTVLERDKMDAILKAQDFNLSDNCNSSDCAVQIGQLLGVELMFAGKIGQFGQVYTIDIRIIDVQSGKIVKTQSENYEGKKEGLLGTIESIAYTVSGKTPPIRSTTETAGGTVTGNAVQDDEIRIGTITKRYGSIELNCEIDGILFIDDKQIGEVSSGSIIPIEKLKPGYHVIRIANATGEFKKGTTVEYGKKVSLTAKASNLSGLAQIMVLVEGGKFEMGNDQGDPDEKPVHSVVVNSFYMSNHEVTQKEWQEVMGTNPSFFVGCEDCPVEKVSWNDAQNFLKNLNAKEGKNYRLPTEAEWEYAARGGQKSKGFKFAGSDDEKDFWTASNSDKKTHTVGFKTPNELGLFDMSGNVWEWCQDWHGPYSGKPEEDPKGPAKGNARVLRGGSWTSGSQILRVTNRNRNNPDNRDAITGFRICVSAE